MATPTPAEAKLLRALDLAGVAYTVYRHQPVATVPEAQAVEKTCGLDAVAAVRTKNLFLTDKKKARRWLVTAAVESRVDLKKLGAVLTAQELKFAADLTEVLQLEPGSATPFGVLNDVGTPPKVVSVLDEAVVNAELALVHPMHNAATLSVRTDALAKFLAAHGHEALVLRFAKDGACEVVSEPTTGSAVIIAAAAAATPEAPPKEAKGKAAAKQASSAESAGGASLFARLEGLMLDDLAVAVKGGELCADGDDERLRARLAALLAPHINGLRNTAYVAGYGAQLASVPKNPVLDF